MFFIFICEFMNHLGEARRWCTDHKEGIAGLSSIEVSLLRADDATLCELYLTSCDLRASEGKCHLLHKGAGHNKLAIA